MTKQNSNKQYDLPLTDKIVVYFLLTLVVYLSIYLCLAKPIAILKSFNPNNRLEGCLYYEGIVNRAAIKVHLEGHSLIVQNMIIRRFPYAKRTVKFEKRNHCYKVKYIVVDFGPFTDFPLLNRYFLYDYIGE